MVGRNWIDYAMARKSGSAGTALREPRSPLRALQGSSIKVDNFLEVMSQYDGPSIILRSDHDNSLLLLVRDYVDRTGHLINA